VGTTCMLVMLVVFVAVCCFCVASCKGLLFLCCYEPVTEKLFYLWLDLFFDEFEFLITNHHKQI
jgi:hypothetical protein